MTIERSKIVEDKYHLAYLFLVIHGIGFLIPWNVFINAKEYYVDYKLNTTISENADYRVNFLSYIGIGAQFPNVIMAAWNTFYQLKTSTSNPTYRFMVVTGIELTILVFTTIMVFVDTSTVPALFFGLTMVSVILINCCVGIHQTLTFGLAAYLPMKYSNAVVIGTNACGVLVASVNMLMKGLATSRDQTDRGIIITRTCYFSFAAAYVLVCIVTYVALKRLKFVSHYLDGNITTEAKVAEKTDDVLVASSVPWEDLPPIESGAALETVGKKGIEEVQPIRTDTSAIGALRNCFALCCFSGHEGRVRCREYWSRYALTFKECWLQCVTVWLVFLCTLTIFPALQSIVKPYNPDYFIPESWFADITCYFFFNLFAMLGCIASNWVRLPGPRFLWIPVLIRAIIFVPFFLVSNYRVDGYTGERQLPLWIRNDHVFVTGCVVFAFTSGYFSSLAMMYAPSKSPPERAGLAGLLASFFLILGVFCGCNMARCVMVFL